jgi:hypothetical protein
MTEGTALIEIGIPHELAEGSGPPPCFLRRLGWRSGSSIS